MEKNNNSILKKHIDKIVTPIFEKAAQETKQNRTLVGQQLKIQDTYSLYNPHNYRLYFDFKKENFHPLRPTKPTSKRSVGRLVIFNSKEWKTADKLNGCVFIVKKAKIEVRNQIEPKRWYLIQLKDIDSRKQQILEIHQKKLSQAIEALKEFIRIYGGSSEYKLSRVWCEEKIMKESTVDKLPLNMFFKARNVKKDYNEPVIEYLGDPVGAANYFSNRGIEDIAPGIADAINLMNTTLQSSLKEITSSMAYFAENQRSHVNAIKELYKLARNINKKLSQKRLHEYL